MNTTSAVSGEDELFNCTVYYTTVPRMDGIRCFTLNLAVTLNIFECTSICMGLCILIILISIFGGIKENYRYFVMNQAFWDFFISYENRCNNQITVFLPLAAPTRNTEKCVYSYFDSIIFRNFFTNIFHSNTFASLLLLSFTRFAAIYFSHSYKKLTHGRRVWYTIFAYNFVIILMHSYFIIDYFLLDRQAKICQKLDAKICDIACAANHTQQCIKADSTLSAFTEISEKFRNIVNMIRPIIFLLLPIFFAILIIIKISRQAKFQFCHNRKMFFGSLRINFVISLQVFITAFIFILQSIDILKKIFLLGNFKTSAWIFGSMGLTMPIPLQMFRQLRILFESILILSVMTGYREAIAAFCKSAFFVIKHPIEAFRSLRYHWRTSRKLSIQINMLCQARVNTSDNF